MFLSALTFTQFVRPVTRFIYEKVEEQAGVAEKTNKNSRGPILSFARFRFLSRYLLNWRHGNVIQRWELMVEERKVRNHKLRQKDRKRLLSSETSFTSPLPSPPPSETKLFSIRVSQKWKFHNEEPTEPGLFVLQTLNDTYAIALDYRTYGLADKSTKYDKTVSSCISKMFENVMSQMKVLFFIPKDAIFTIGFLATFELACDTNRIHEGGAMRAVPH